MKKKKKKRWLLNVVLNLKYKILNGIKEGQRKVYKKCILLKKQNES